MNEDNQDKATQSESGEETPLQGNIEPNDNSTIWKRLLFMLLFCLIYSVTEVVLGAVVILQFGFVMFANERNDKLLDLGANISTFIFAILNYLTFNSEQRPFPFSDWPGEAHDERNP